MSRFLVRPDDVLFNATNSPEGLGKSIVVGELDEPAVFSNHFLRLRVDPAQLDSHYLHRWLQAQFASGVFKAMARQWVNQATVERIQLLSLAVPLPALAEQRRIAAILDQADALRNARREALDLLAGLAPALFEDLFRPIPRGATTFGDLAEVQGGLQVTSARSKLPQSAPYLRVANVHRNQLDLSVVKDIQVTPVELARTGLLEGDLLFVEGHANPLEVGRVAMWDGSIPGCTHQNHLIRGRLDTSRCHPVFATYWLNSPRGAAHFRREGKTTSGLNTISASTVRSAPMLLPPIELQREFATKVGEISAQREAAQRSLATLEDLLRSTQARAFSGQL